MNQVWVDQHKNAFLNAICGMQPMLGFTSLHCCTVLLAFNIRYGTRRTRISNKWTVPHSNRTQIKVFLLICFFPKEWNQLILINLLLFFLCMCMCLCEYVFACIFKLVLSSCLSIHRYYHLESNFICNVPFLLYSIWNAFCRNVFQTMKCWMIVDCYRYWCYLQEGTNIQIQYCNHGLLL